MAGIQVQSQQAHLDKRENCWERKSVFRQTEKESSQQLTLKDSCEDGSRGFGGVDKRGW